jgi:hypothetical protein
VQDVIDIITAAIDQYGGRGKLGAQDICRAMATSTDRTIRGESTRRRLSMSDERRKGVCGEDGEE